MVRLSRPVYERSLLLLQGWRSLNPMQTVRLLYQFRRPTLRYPKCSLLELAPQRLLLRLFRLGQLKLMADGPHPLPKRSTGRPSTTGCTLSPLLLLSQRLALHSRSPDSLLLSQSQVVLQPQLFHQGYMRFRFRSLLQHSEQPKELVLPMRPYQFRWWNYPRRLLLVFGLCLSR